MSTSTPTFAAAVKPVVAAISATTKLPAPTRMIDVTNDEIVIWHGQPRLARNPRYDSIKESIRNLRALERPIDLTEEPGTFGYVTRRGGSTRLQILNELWEETGDRKFYQHTFPLYEYPGVAAMRISHCIENTERGEQFYGDTARAIVDLCSDLESEISDFQNLSLRDKASAITQRGLSIQANRLMLYLYTEERLHDYLPTAFNAGLGRPRVEAIRKLDKQFIEQVEQHALDRLADWHTVFLDTLKASDSTHVDIAALERTLKIRLKSDFDIHPDKPIEPAKERNATGCPPIDQGAENDPKNTVPDLEGSSRPPIDPDVSTETADSSSESDSKPPSPADARQPIGGETQETSVPSGNSGPQIDTLTSLSSIRDKASTLTVELATEYGMVGGGLFRLQDPEIGLCYQITSPDDIRLHEREDWMECLLVHSVMHSCMWASIMIEIDLGFIRRDVLEEIDESSPDRIGRSEAWQPPRSAQVLVHRQCMVSRINAGIANDREIDLISKIESLEDLAASFASAMRTQRDCAQESPDERVC